MKCRMNNNSKLITLVMIVIRSWLWIDKMQILMVWPWLRHPQWSWTEVGDTMSVIAKHGCLLCHCSKFYRHTECDLNTENQLLHDYQSSDGVLIFWTAAMSSWIRSFGRAAGGTAGPRLTIDELRFAKWRRPYRLASDMHISRNMDMTGHSPYFSISADTSEISR